MPIVRLERTRRAYKDVSMLAACPVSATERGDDLSHLRRDTAERTTDTESEAVSGVIGDMTRLTEVSRN